MTTGIRNYFGFRYFDEIPYELTNLILECVKLYRVNWYSEVSLGDAIKLCNKELDRNE